MRVREEAEGKEFGVIVMAEGLAEFLPHTHIEGVPRDEHGHIAISKLNLSRLFSDLVAKEYTKQTGKKRKITGLQLGYESRCARPQAFDVMLGSQLGVGAYRALVEKRLDGVMVSVSGQLELNYVPVQPVGRSGHAGHGGPLHRTQLRFPPAGPVLGNVRERLGIEQQALDFRPEAGGRGPEAKWKGCRMKRGGDYGDNHARLSKTRSFFRLRRGGALRVADLSQTHSHSAGQYYGDGFRGSRRYSQALDRPGRALGSAADHAGQSRSGIGKARFGRRFDYRPGLEYRLLRNTPMVPRSRRVVREHLGRGVESVRRRRSQTSHHADAVLAAHEHSADDRRWSEPGPTAVLEHGANPGLISHWTKQGLIDIGHRLLKDKKVDRCRCRGNPPTISPTAHSTAWQ